MVSPLRRRAALDDPYYKTHTVLRAVSDNSAPPPAILHPPALLFLSFDSPLHSRFALSFACSQCSKFSPTSKYKETLLCQSLPLTTTQSSEFPQQERNPHSQKKEFSFVTKKLWEQITHSRLQQQKSTKDKTSSSKSVIKFFKQINYRKKESREREREREREKNKKAGNEGGLSHPTSSFVAERNRRDEKAARHG